MNNLMLYVIPNYIIGRMKRFSNSFHLFSFIQTAKPYFKIQDQDTRVPHLS